MSKTVLDKVKEKCRNALKANIPVVYIKTDSDIFIHKLLMDSPALVTRMWNSEEYPQKENCAIKPDDGFCFEDIGNYSLETADKPINPLDCRKPQYPFIRAFKVTEDPSFEKLTEYILRHENPKDSSYEVFQNSLVILYSSVIYADENLLPYMDIIELDFPDEDEIKEIVVTESENYYDCDDADDYSNILLGLTSEEVTMLTKRMAAASTHDAKKLKKIIYDYKSQKLHGGYLELCKVSNNELGGMDLYTPWLSKQQKPLLYWYSYKKQLGILPPRGVLLCGIPGCGKSAAANYTAYTLGLPLLRMDIGRLMDKYQGEAEKRMEAALKLAESMSCVLWIDELEKGFSGAGADNDDSASFKRVFAHLLTWMQVHEKPCFIFATANNIGPLPKEFFRSGRFDELFAVYLPLESDCISIFKAIMSKYENKTERKIFDNKCKEDKLFKEVIRESLIENGKPRMVIGSDIEKAISIALKELKDMEIIDCDSWKNELKAAFDSCTVYGDSEENVESIAVSYCRMLRKGMTPTSKHVLFKPENYHVGNYGKIKEIKEQKSTLEKAEYEKQLEENAILQSESCPCVSDYDKLIYEVLKDKINEFAYDIEENERYRLVRM